MDELEPMRFQGLTKKMVAIALLVLGTAGAQGEGKPDIRPVAPRTIAGPVLADVDLDEVPVGRALRLLAETYDVSIATGALPDTRVTIRLRNIGAEEAFAAVAAAAGLEVVHDGSVVRLASRSPEAARQIAPCGVAADCAVPAVSKSRGACCWEGCGNAGNGKGRQLQVVDRVFHLGMAPGEETLKAVR